MRFLWPDPSTGSAPKSATRSLLAPGTQTVPFRINRH